MINPPLSLELDLEIPLTQLYLHQSWGGEDLSPAAMLLSTHTPVINPTVPKGEGRLLQPKLSFNPITNQLISSRTSDLETNQGNVNCKRKQGPRPRDVNKTVQMNLSSYLLTVDRKCVRAGTPSKSTSQ